MYIFGTVLKENFNNKQFREFYDTILQEKSIRPPYFTGQSYGDMYRVSLETDAAAYSTFLFDSSKLITSQYHLDHIQKEQFYVKEDIELRPHVLFGWNTFVHDVYPVGKTALSLVDTLDQYAHLTSFPVDELITKFLDGNIVVNQKPEYVLLALREEKTNFFLDMRTREWM